LWSESLRSRTDAALAAFEGQLSGLGSYSDEDVLGVVQRVVLALNQINEDHRNAGLTGYETGEREELSDYIEASLAESGIDVEALSRRNGIGLAGIAGPWRSW